MTRFKRKKNGRFKAKSNEDRKVRSIRATDSAWESLGDLAESQNMTRADFVEQLVQDGKLDCIQGLELLEAIANRVDSRVESPPIEDLAKSLDTAPHLEPLQELADRLQPIQSLAHKLEPLQELAHKLEPMRDLAQTLEAIQNLSQKLEPIQSLAQSLEPLCQISQIQALGEQAEIIQQIVKQVNLAYKSSEAHKAQSPANAYSVALNLVKTFMAEKRYGGDSGDSLDGSTAGASLDGISDAASPASSSAESPSLNETSGDRLMQFQHWLIAKLDTETSPQ